MSMAGGAKNTLCCDCILPRPATELPLSCVFDGGTSSQVKVPTVLVFPPVNSFFRYLIHQLAQDSFGQLRTFSIGEDPDRRIVVCTKELVARVDGKEDDATLLKTVAESKTSPSQLTMVISNADSINSLQVKKSRASLPSVGIYRPPAARRSLQESLKEPPPPPAQGISGETVTKDSAKPASRARARRPDIQVYVPRAKRLSEDVSTPLSNHLKDSQGQDSNRTRAHLIIDDRNSSKRRSSSPSSTPPPSLPPRASQLVETKKKLSQSASFCDLGLEGDDSSVHQSETVSAPAPNMNPPLQQMNLPARAAVLVEKKKKLCQSDSVSDDFKLHKEENEGNRPSYDAASTADADSSAEETSRSDRNYISSEMEKRLKIAENLESELGDRESTSVINSEVTNKLSSTESSEKTSCDVPMCFVDATLPKDILTVQEKLPFAKSKCDKSHDSSDDDFQDAHNKEDHNGLSVMSDRSSGSNESLSSGDSLNSPVKVQLMKPVKVEPSKKSTKTTKPARTFNPDECDWDALIDEDGEILDPFLMKELTSAVGEVHVTQPQSDYRDYRSQLPADHNKTRRSAGDDDFGHVVEIYNFPREFKTNDLVAVFTPFKNTGGGFEIKWVDDTHALGVFASALVAEQVLEYKHPMVRTRPLCDGTLESRLKARRLSESITTFRPRPETCAALARRLVTGALGVRLATARQERVEEMRVLKEAREKRRLAAKQRDDIWNNG